MLCPYSVCVCSLVGTLWAVLRGAQSHSANGASGTASESIRPHYSSCSATVLFFPPSYLPLLLSLLTLNPSFLSFSTRPCSQPRVVCSCPAPLAGTYITPSERESERERPSQLAALTLIDLAPMLTQTPRETLQRRRHRGVWECILQGGMRGWYGGTLKLTAGQSVFLSVCLCVCLSGRHRKPPHQLSVVFTVTVARPLSMSHVCTGQPTAGKPNQFLTTCSSSSLLESSRV